MEQIFSYIYVYRKSEKRLKSMPKIHHCLLVTFLISLAAGAYAQRIENVRPEIAGERIHVYYDLLEIAADQPVIVRVYMSTDGGQTYGEPLVSVSGDVGIVVGPGGNKRIIWDVFEDVDELVSENIKFRVQADLIQSGQGRQPLVPGFAFNLNAELGTKVRHNAYGFNLKAAVYLRQLGLGVRGHYYKTFGEEPDNANEGYYWGFSGGAVIDYDIIRNRKYSLYPFMYIGQTKILRVEESLADEHSGYSIFYSPGLGFNIRVLRSLYLGAELEYYMAPRVDIIDRGSSAIADNIIIDGLSIGFVIKFVIHPD
jgi:hypothetical protein